MAEVGSPPPARIKWLSPLVDHDYAEYQVEYFLELLGVLPLKNKQLKEFWPTRGPVWDGLGRIEDKAYFLIEAKSHIPEIVSGRTGATAEASIELITASLDETKRFLGSSSKADWSQPYYQYTNRLAHLYLLRELNGLPAYLVNLYFVNDSEQKGPASRKEWEGALQLLKLYLGVKRHKLTPYTIDLFFDVVDWRFV